LALLFSFLPFCNAALSLSSSYPSSPMCRSDKVFGSEYRERKMGIIYGSDKLKASSLSRPRVKLWMLRAATVILLWLCTVQLSALADLWGPRVLKGLPSCLIASPYSSFSAIQLSAQVVERSPPPESELLF
jgi:hypothetical protein